MEEKKKKGRPSSFSQEIANEICEATAKTSRGYDRLREKNPHWPSEKTMQRWEKDIESFRLQYALAKRDQIDFMAREIIDIADNGTNDFYEDSEGKLKPDIEHINRSRLRVDTRKWYTSKLAPKIYGERLFNEQKVEFSYDKIDAMSDAELSEFVSKAPQRLHDAFIKDFAKKAKEAKEGKKKVR